jgi:thiamine-phosphate pyrophosphorylase
MEPFKLMLVTHRQERSLGFYLDFIEACVCGGVTSVQLREKNLRGQELLHFGHGLMERLAPYHIPLIVNDDLELATHLGAAGLHLGQKDLANHPHPLPLGPLTHFGLTVDTLDQLHVANSRHDLTYIGVGAIFPSPTKKDVTTVWGIDGLRAIAQATTHPLVAIGGITLETAPAVMAAGATGLALISALHEAKNPEAMTRAFRKIIDTNDKGTPHHA